MMKNKMVLITGATSGIGRIAVKELAKMGAKLILVVRNEQKVIKLKNEIQSETDNTSIDYFICDLSVQEEVYRVAADIKNKYDKIDVLINNAGLIVNDRILTPDGIEYTFALNHLGYFLLTGLLLESLNNASPSRIINVSSEAHKVGKINYDDLTGEKKYKPMVAYCQSKLANILFTKGLAKKIEGSGITVNTLHPGSVKSSFGSDLTGLLGFLMKLSRPFLISPEKGAQTLIYLASSPEVEGITGKYFVKKRIKNSSRLSNDETVANKLWKVSEELTGFHYPDFSKVKVNII